mmetsp:Transcript_21983/g.62646  ORF Transcript_21983/g.62646 Transcript_21983/m.62646 type:complete len:119 (+) Transcript_21983:319-675(+)
MDGWMGGGGISQCLSIWRPIDGLTDRHTHYKQTWWMLLICSIGSIMSVCLSVREPKIRRPGSPSISIHHRDLPSCVHRTHGHAHDMQEKRWVMQIEIDRQTDKHTGRQAGRQRHPLLA